MTTLWIAAGFVAGVLAGWWWNRRAALDVLKAAESAASIANGYCTQGMASFGSSTMLMQTLDETKKEVARFADEHKTAAQQLDAMDRTLGVMLTALIDVGVVRTTGGKHAGDDRRPGDEFAG